MSRLHLLRPEEMDPAQRAVHEGLTGGKRATGRQLFRLTHDDGSLTGPFNALLYSPELGGTLQAVGEVIRFGSSLPAPAREIAILLVARRWSADYEWYAHEPIALDVGVSPAVVTAIREGRPPDLDDPVEEAVAAVGRALLDVGEVDDATYDRAASVLGEATLVEVTILIGYYTALALLLSTFHIGVPEGDAPLTGSPR